MIGTTLGPYRIVEKLGEGGMGQVYRARDTRLDRDVAVKILPDVFASDPERIARFEREAKTLASLNHPHIAQIHGFETSGTVSALVMELVAGEDLSQRIARGPMPVEEVLLVARQIAEALAAAHEQGIIHRDLKPANIKLRPDGTVKVLDFGLAVGARHASPGQNTAPITSPGVTAQGVILGTAAYMSPEQARGQVVDKRSDIWSFGCVLYEMLTGRAAFAAETVTDTLAAVVTRPPDWSVLPSSTPPAIAKLLQRCLERDPKRRLHDAADVRIELEDPEVLAPAPMMRPTTQLITWRTVATVALVAAAAAAIVTWLALGTRNDGTAEPVRRFALTELDSMVIDPFQSLALSPDGRTLAYRGRGSDGGLRIFVRPFDAIQPTPVAGTDGAQLPFFSADGRWLGFFANGELRKVPLTGGAPQTIARITGPAFGAAWMDDGTIVFVGDEGLQRVSSLGGQPETLLAKAASGTTIEMSAPAALPGSAGVLVLVRRVSRMELAVFSIRDKTLTTLVEDAGTPTWVDSGHVLFHQRSSIVALPFDPARLSATGPAVPVVSGLGIQISTQSRMFAASSDGTLAYIPAAPSGSGEASLLWVDRTGQEKLVSALERVSDLPRLSPDGTRVAFRAPSANCDIWVYDLERSTTTRLTRGNADHHGVVWAADGRSIFTARLAEQGADIIALPADGSGAPKVLGQSPSNAAVPSSWSTAADALLVFERRPQTQVDVMAYPTTGGQARAVLETPASETSAVFSPDSRFIAYASDESGRSEIYVRPYRGEGSRIQISTGGGSEPVWARDGSALFFRNGRDLLMASTSTGEAFVAGRPLVLFSTGVQMGTLLLPNFDVAPDGQRFLMMRGRQWLDGQVIVVLNWLAEWKQLGSGGASPRP